MALADKDIFAAICQSNKGQPIEVIMERYAEARRLNMEIDRRLHGAAPETAIIEVEETVPEPEVEEKPDWSKFNRRRFKVRPDDAIRDTGIFCCLCGEERQSLTAKHFAMHGITVEEYKKLCGYSPDQPLMSRQRLAKSQETMALAQKARMERRKEKGEGQS